MHDRMMNIREVRNTLGLSAAEVIRLVQIGRLRAYKYAGDGPVSMTEVNTLTNGLRFRDSDVEAMLEDCLVK